MGRELRRKQAKRDGKNVREVQKKTKDKPLAPKTLVIILVTLLVFFVILYILTGLFITKELKWFNNNNNEENEVTEVENKILAIDTLRQAEEEYYVYFYDPSDEDSDVSNKLYSVNEKVYRVDLSSDFNANYVGEPSGIVKDINDLKVNNPTVIKVSSEKMVAFYSGTDEIIIALK